MINLKNDKGVTLLVLTITIIVLLIITSITLSNSQSQLAIKKVNELYNDIDSINTKIADYYLKNNSLPVLEHTYLNSPNALKLLCISNGENENLINANDDGNYYVIDLSQLENLTLNYGKQYKDWTETSTFQNYQDLYIINEVSHQIYYPQGIKYNGEIYYTKSSSAETINVIESSGQDTSNGDIKIESITAEKKLMEDTQNIIISSTIKLNIGFEYQKESLKYSWKLTDAGEENGFTAFSLDDTNNANLMSNQLENVDTYYLHIKVKDMYGNEHTIKQEIKFN